jgi:pilus assembly protein CpaE
MSQHPGTATAVLGAKGGVGTTTVACNLAAQLYADGAGRVLLVDLHLFLGDVGFRLGLEQQPTVMAFLRPTGTSPDWSSGPPRHPVGFHLLGLAPDLEDADHIEAAHIVDFLSAARRHFDHVVVDCGSDLTESSLAACRYANRRLLITTEQRPSLIGAQRRLHVLEKLDIDGSTAIGIINRAHPDGITEEQVRNAIGLQVGARLRNAWQDHQTALSQQQLLRESCPGAKISADYTRLSSIVQR